MLNDICLVPGQSSPDSASDASGPAFLELALLLATAGHRVSILLWRNEPSTLTEELWRKAVDQQPNIQILICHVSDYITGPAGCREVSYAIARHFIRFPRHYRGIHFAEQGGLAYFTLQAIKSGIYSTSAQIIVHLHGPIRWRFDVSRTLFHHAEHLRMDFMEREAIEKCDLLVSSSEYLLSWLRQADIALPTAEKIKVIRNLCTGSRRPGSAQPVLLREVTSVRAIAFLGCFDEQDGLTVFLEAICAIDDFLHSSGIEVHLVGDFGLVDGIHSGIYLSHITNKIKTRINFHLGRTRTENISCLRKICCPVVVSALKEENTPYVVLDSLSLGLPVLVGKAGGSGELQSPETGTLTLVETNPSFLAERLKEVISRGCPVPSFASSEDSVEQEWLRVYQVRPKISRFPIIAGDPRVVLGITTFERPTKVIDAVLSAARQTYKNLEIVVVDDGSKSPESLEQMPHLSALLSRFNGRLIRRENGYLGAARNTIVTNTNSDYIVFLDDDDIASDDMVANFVQAAKLSSVDIVTCPSVAMAEVDRGNILHHSRIMDQKPYYIPLGGPLSLGPIENCFSSATSLIHRSVFHDVGLFSELMKVGFEDYEFYFRAAQNGKTFTVCPAPGFFYEIKPEGMVNNTPYGTNFRRVIEHLEIERNPRAWLDFIGLQTGSRAWFLERDKQTRREAAGHVGRFHEIIAGKKTLSKDFSEAVSRYCSEYGLQKAAKNWLVNAVVQG